MNVSTGHEIMTEQPFALSTSEVGETTATKILVVEKLLRIRLQKYPTYYFTLSNNTKLDSQVSITMTNDSVDFSCNCKLTIQAGETVTIPVPTGNSEFCNIITSQKLELVQLSYQYVNLSSQINNKAFEISAMECTRGTVQTGNRLFNMLNSSATISIKPIRGAAVYSLELESNRRLIIVRGRITYFTIGKVCFATSEDYLQDMYIRNGEPCIVNIISKVETKYVSPQIVTNTWRV